MAAEPKHVPIDETDRRLLRALQEDGRITTRR